MVPAVAGDGDNFVVGIIEGRPDEIVHGGVDDDEAFLSGALHIFDPSDEDAGVADDETAGLD